MPAKLLKRTQPPPPASRSTRARLAKTGENENGKPTEDIANTAEGTATTTAKARKQPNAKGSISGNGKLLTLTTKKAPGLGDLKFVFGFKSY